MAIYNSQTYPSYNPYQVAYSPPAIASPPQPDTNMIWVQGEAGAKAYPVQNGKTVVLFDSEAERFYIKMADTSGIPQPLRIFNYTEVKEEPTKAPVVDPSLYITRDEFEKAIKSLKDKQQQNNGQGKDGNKHGKPSVQ